MGLFSQVSNSESSPRERLWKYASAVILTLAVGLFFVNMILVLSRGDGFVRALSFGVMGFAGVMLTFLPVLLFGRPRRVDEGPPAASTAGDDFQSDPSGRRPPLRP